MGRMLGPGQAGPNFIALRAFDQKAVGTLTLSTLAIGVLSC
jgi:hypothetical protein